MREVEKAYKLLAKQEKISNSQAKELIDRGLVSYKGEKLSLARALVSSKAHFSIAKEKKIQILFEDENIIALNKPFGVVSETLEKKFKHKLLNRLDKETSGVLLFYKNDEFKALAIKEYKNQRVAKTYIAILNGILAQNEEINELLSISKNKGGAFAKVSKEGLNATTLITPLAISGKKTLAKIEIPTGRTHQIRVHCAFINHGVIGDEKYAKISAPRMYLHCYETRLLSYEFKANLDESFNAFGFDSKNLLF